MTLLVRDEVDVVRENIDFHLNHGVDFIVATDNGSIDGTRDVLLEYQAKGVLHLIDEPGRDMSQAAWVNRMARVAYHEYAANAIFHTDADEFWLASDGDLRTEIFASAAPVLSVPRRNVLLRRRSQGEIFPDDAKYVVVRPRRSRNLARDLETTNFLLSRHAPKVMFRTATGPLDVSEGNHCVVGFEDRSDHSRAVVILHYPVRGRAGFFSKVENFGSSFARNTDLPESVGFHQRAWYRHLLDGTLDREYGRLTISRTDALWLGAIGAITSLSRFTRGFALNSNPPGVVG